jgi:hypothetical protein
MSTAPINRHWTNPDGTHDGSISSGTGYLITWQRGPLSEGRNGAFLTEVLGSVIDQVHYFRNLNSDFDCEENVQAEHHLKLALAALERRLQRRYAEGILGTHQVDETCEGPIDNETR